MRIIPLNYTDYPPQKTGGMNSRKNPLCIFVGKKFNAKKGLFPVSYRFFPFV